MAVKCICTDKTTKNGTNYFRLKNRKNKSITVSEEQLKILLFTEQVLIDNIALEENGEITTYAIKQDININPADIETLQKFIDLVNSQASYDIAYMGRQIFEDNDISSRLHKKYFKKTVDILSEILKRQVIIENGTESIFFIDAGNYLLSAGLCLFQIYFSTDIKDTGEAYAKLSVIFPNNSFNYNEIVCTDAKSILQELAERGAYSKNSLHKILNKISNNISNISMERFGKYHSWLYMSITSLDGMLFLEYNNDHEYYNRTEDLLLRLASSKGYLIHTDDSHLMISEYSNKKSEGNEYLIDEETPDEDISEMIYDMVDDLVPIT